MTEEITSNTPAPDAFEAALAANADDLATPVAEVVQAPVT
jgi:transcriptional antiterminator NusG